MLLKRQNPPMRQRRQRTNFNESQIEYLDQMFVKNPYPDINERDNLAASLNTTEDRIQVWFQNKRARYRKKMGKENETKTKIEKLEKKSCQDESLMNESSSKLSVITESQDSGYQSNSTISSTTPNTSLFQPLITFNQMYHSSPYPTIYLPTTMFTCFQPAILQNSPIAPAPPNQANSRNSSSIAFRPYE